MGEQESATTKTEFQKDHIGHREEEDCTGRWRLGGW